MGINCEQKIFLLEKTLLNFFIVDKLLEKMLFNFFIVDKLWIVLF